MFMYYTNTSVFRNIKDLALIAITGLIFIDKIKMLVKHTL